MLLSIAIIVLLFPFWAFVNAGCPNGFTIDKNSGKCVQFFKAPTSFQDAEQNCVSLGAHLVSIQNAFQNNAVLGSAQNSFGSSNYWIGAYYNGSQWAWTDGSPFSFSQWAAREPSTFFQCAMVLSSAGGTWKTSDCTGTLPYICASTANSPTTENPKTTTKTQRVTTTAPAVTTKPPVQMYCEPGWELFQQTLYCYKMYTNANFDDANAICQGAGANLVSIHSDAENQFVYNMTRGVYSSHIGLHRTSYSSAWIWTDGSVVNYVNWDPTAPDHKNQQANCVELFSDKVANTADKSEWQNIDCNDISDEFVCKKPSTTNPPPSATPSAGLCDHSGWTYFSQTRYCYAPFTTTGDFYDAEALCAKQGSHLVSIHSVAENSFIYNMTRRAEETFIGLHRASQQSAWTWTDGSAVNYVNWDAAAPNNKDLSANCVVMYSDEESWLSYRQQWNNIHCEPTTVEMRYGVCKKIAHF